MYDDLHIEILDKIAAHAWVLRFPELTGGRNADEKIAGHRGHRHDLAAAPGIRGSLVARIDRSANGVGPVRYAGIGHRRFAVLPGVPVPQSCHRRIRRDFPALAAMDAAGRPSDGHRSAAGVRHVGAVAERDNAAGVSSARARAHRDHCRAALAAGGREPKLIRRAESRSDLSPAAKGYFPFVLPVVGLALMRVWLPSIFSTSKAPVFRTRSLSLLWP